MSLEDNVLRLARAVEAQGEASAVAEIIRQRNQALKDLESMTQSRDYWDHRYQNRDREYDHLVRVANGLRGAITRQRNQKVPRGTIQKGTHVNG